MSDPEVLQLLLEMGFPHLKAEKALKESGNVGIEAAMEWLMTHEDDDGSSVSAVDEQPGPSSCKQSENEQAKSIKCTVCNKLFNSSEEVEYHAVKSGHNEFSESTEVKKPLTEEEKKEQLRLLEEKMKIKRQEREQREKTEELDKEKRRIQSGKEMAAMREKMRDDETRKMVADRKREKAEEEAAKARVRAQIEADKAARRAKQAVASTPVPVSSPITTSNTASSSAQKQYSDAKLQIRLPSGTTMTHTFGSKEPLSAVRLYIQMNRTDGDSGPFCMMTNFPKKVFSNDDFDTPLDVLGLVPSSVIIVTRPQL